MRQMAYHKCMGWLMDEQHQLLHNRSADHANLRLLTDCLSILIPRSENATQFLDTMDLRERGIRNNAEG